MEALISIYGFLITQITLEKNFPSDLFELSRVAFN